MALKTNDLDSRGLDEIGITSMMNKICRTHMKTMITWHEKLQIWQFANLRVTKMIKAKQIREHPFVKISWKTLIISLWDIILFSIFGIQLLSTVTFLLIVSFVLLIGLNVFRSIKSFITNYAIDLWKNICYCLVYLYIWFHNNSVIFRQLDAKPTHIINLMGNLVEDMGYYSIMSSFFSQDNCIGTQLKSKMIIVELETSCRRIDKN